MQRFIKLGLKGDFYFDLFKDIEKDFKKLEKEIELEIDNWSKRKIYLIRKETINKITHNIWTKDGKGTANQERLDYLIKTSILSVEGNKCFVYKEKHHIKDIEYSPQYYKILICLLENKGSAKPKEIYKVLYPEKTGTKKTSTMIKNISTPICRLRSILKKNGMNL